MITLKKNLNASVVIPTYNRKKLLKATLLALSKQNYPKEKYEIIVVDDGDDGTDEMIKNLKISNLRYFKIKKRLGRAKARNFGIKKAIGELILFIDSDMIAGKNLIEEHAKMHRNNNSIVIGYRKEFINDKLIADPREIDFKFCEDNLGKLKNPWKIFYSSNASVRKQHLIVAGMFDENFKKWGHEDWELGYRLFKKGLQFKLNRKAVAIHQSHLTEYKNIQEMKKLLNESTNYFYKKYLDNEILSELKEKLEIKVGKLCNNNCIYCLLLGKKNEKNESLKQIKQHLATMVNKEELIISGGEPALRKDVFNIVDYAKRIGFKKVILETNGRLFCYKDFCEKMIQTGVDQFDIYLYSHKSEVHDKITRVKGSWMQTIEGIKNLIDLNAVVQVNVVVCKENYKNLLKITKALNKLNVHHVKFNILSYSFNPYKDMFEKFQIPTSSSFINTINKIRKASERQENLHDYLLKNKIN